MEGNIYKRFFEQVTEGLALVDSKGTIIETNEAFAKIFGYDLVEMHGMAIHELVPNDIRKDHVKHHQSYQENPTSRKMGKGRDLYGKRKNGDLVPVEVALSMVEGSEQRITAVIVTDISDRKDTQEKIRLLNEELQQTVSDRTSDLKASQQLYSLISQNFPNGTINVLSKSLTYIFVEGLELKRMEINSSQMIGSSYINRIPKPVQPIIREKLNRVFAGTGEKFDIELNDQMYEMTAVPLKRDGNDVNQILVVERNVTDERRARQEIERALKKEKDLNELKSRFVSMASHEFRTPLTTIKSSAALISKYTESDQQDKRLKHIGRIESSVSHLTGILNDILSLSKLEEDRIESKMETIDLLDFLEDIVSQMKLYDDNKVELSFELNGDHSFVSDTNILRNILVNLMSNAIKYSQQDGKVNLCAINADGHLTITITDNGIGIPEEDQPQLFERFFRAQNATNIEGTGLGLNIVSRFLEVLGGDITFKSQPGVETEFKFMIPNGKL